MQAPEKQRVSSGTMAGRAVTGCASRAYTHATAPMLKDRHARRMGLIALREAASVFPASNPDQAPTGRFTGMTLPGPDRHRHSGLSRAGNRLSQDHTDPDSQSEKCSCGSGWLI